MKRATIASIAAEINADPSLGLRATHESSYASTDRKLAGTRLSHHGKGSKGRKLTVVLVRTGEVVCCVNTAFSWELARDAAEWLEKWRRFERTYWRAGSAGVYLVPGEPTKPPAKKAADLGPCQCQIRVQDQSYNLRRMVWSYKSAPCPRRAREQVKHLKLCRQHAEFAREGVMPSDGCMEDATLVRERRNVRGTLLFTWAR